MEKTILITGCSSGIGLEAATTLLNRGYTVFATARKQTDIDHLRSIGLNALCLDVSNSHSIDEALKDIFEVTSGQLYALFNNAGFGIPGAVEDLSRQALRDQFETNLFGAFELINKIMPVMRRQGYGRIVQNSSVLGFVALPLRGAYNSSKFAMEGLTDTMRLELADTNIHISLIEPGPVESKFRKNSFNAFKQYIDFENSVFANHYTKLEQRLTHEGHVVPFTLPSSSVMPKLIHALESPNPKARYYVTFPTHLFSFLKRILPTPLLDKILRKV